MTTARPLFIGNHLTPKAKTVKVQTECVNRTLVQYNPEIVKATKEAALPVLLQREAKDNEIAAQKGLKPYTLLNVEFNEGADEKTGGYIGWYYVTLAVDGKICTHLETGLNHDIADGKVSDTPTRADYYPAGALKEADVDYVFNNVGFSSASTLYMVPLRDDVRERAEKTLAERSAAAPEAGREWGFYIIPDLKTWATHAEQQTPIEHFATFEEAKARFDELRGQPYNKRGRGLERRWPPLRPSDAGHGKQGRHERRRYSPSAGGPELSCGRLHPHGTAAGAIPWYWKASPAWQRKSALTGCGPMCMENGSYKAMPDMPFHPMGEPLFRRRSPGAGAGRHLCHLPSCQGGPGGARLSAFRAYEELAGQRGWPWTGKTTRWSTRPRWTARTTLEDIYRTFNTDDRPADFTRPQPYPFPMLWC